MGNATSPVELLQGTADLLILRALLFGPSHGLAIPREIRATSQGVLQVETGSLCAPSIGSRRRARLAPSSLAPTMLWSVSSPRRGRASEAAVAVEHRGQPVTVQSSADNLLPQAHLTVSRRLRISPPPIRNI